MEKKIMFTRKQIALFISVVLHFISSISTEVYKVILLPKPVSTFILVLWVIVDLVLVYRVAAELSSVKTKAD